MSGHGRGTTPWAERRATRLGLPRRSARGAGTKSADRVRNRRQLQANRASAGPLHNGLVMMTLFPASPPVLVGPRVGVSCSPPPAAPPPLLALEPPVLLAEPPPALLPASATATSKPTAAHTLNEHDALLLAIDAVVRIILLPADKLHGNDLADLARALQLAPDSPRPKRPLLVPHRAHRLWTPERGSAPRGRPLLHHKTLSPSAVPVVGADDVEFVSVARALRFDHHGHSREALRDALVRETSRRVFGSRDAELIQVHRHKVGGLLVAAFVCGQ